ncbi:hypothetical protein M569_01482, partial [Genlisea aurea]
MEGLTKEHGKPWRVLEFYSGIGGMRYSLEKAGVDAMVVEAFDINEVANDVYEHNFGHRPYQANFIFLHINFIGNIQALRAADLDNYKAEVWLLSPPCQPYTRQGHQKGSTDARAASFLRILQLIPQCSVPPLMLFVENVVGFENSDTHKKMMAALGENHYQIQEFVLSPLQFGVPYSRPRYFCLAKLKPLLFSLNELIAGPVVDSSQEYWNRLAESCHPVRHFLEKKIMASEHVDDPLKQYLVPSSLVERWGSAMDIVFPESKRCCCFTKSYFRYVKGTGSLLATISSSERRKADLLPLEEEDLRLRYFTPREVANLHSFPEEFGFPEHVSLRQRYALLGNSLSVGVVAPLLRHLFS